MIVTNGIRNMPSQNTADENTCVPWPAMYSGEKTRIEGQNLPNIKTYNNL